MLAVMAFIVVAVTVAFVIRIVVFLFGIMFAGAFHDLFQFTPVQPDAATFRAVIDFNSVLFAYQQRFIAGRAFHIFMLVWFKRNVRRNSVCMYYRLCVVQVLKK